MNILPPVRTPVDAVQLLMTTSRRSRYSNDRSRDIPSKEQDLQTASEINKSDSSHEGYIRSRRSRRQDSDQEESHARQFLWEDCYVIKHQA